MNPRVLLWLEAVGRTTADIARPSGADVPMVMVNGERNLWTVHYMGWIQCRWSDWAASLGFKDHRDALLSGHTDDEFDTWLRRSIR